ncbi:MAG TPA: nucleotide-binding protein [Methanosarcinaceae archaeon]|nr:nucleotide-binding protein [Methanosarcinaceae archaeon]
MEKEEKIVAVLLTMAILSLGVAYVTFFQGNGEGINNDALQLTELSSVGDLVYFEGSILSKKFTFKGDHLLLSVDYNQNIVKVFIPNNNGAVDIDNTVNENDYVRIQGIVDEYQGEYEIVVQSKNDVKAL